MTEENTREEPLTKESDVRGAFVDSLKRNNRKIRDDRAASILDLSLLKYGISKDDGILNNLSKATLVITCCDQIEELLYTIDGNAFEHQSIETFCSDIAKYLNIKKIITVKDPAFIGIE